LAQRLWKLVDAYNPRVLALDFSAVPDIEYSALKMMIEGEERFRQNGVELWLVAFNSEALRMVQRSTLGEKLGRERLIFNMQTAVDRYREKEWSDDMG
jgi:SulP family sulfate permease